MSDNKRVNLSFSSDEFELIEAIATKTNRKVANLVRTWALDKLNGIVGQTIIKQSNSDVYDDEERAILSDTKLMKRLQDALKRSQSGNVLKRSRYISS